MEIRQHPRFKSFFNAIKDPMTKARILLNVTRLAAGNTGNVRSVGGGVWELKIDYGPGWRIYYTKVGRDNVLLLTGGNKKAQQRDIEAAKKMAQEIHR